MVNHKMDGNSGGGGIISDNFPLGLGGDRGLAQKQGDVLQTEIGGPIKAITKVEKDREAQKPFIEKLKYLLGL